MRQCIHLTLLVGDIIGTTPLRLRLSVQPAIQKIISHQPPHSFLARKGFSRRFAAKLSHKQPGSRIVGLVIIIIIIHPNRRSTPTPTSPPSAIRPADSTQSQHQDRPAARHNCASTKTWWKDFALLMQCLHPMPMSMSPVPDRVAKDETIQRIPQKRLRSGPTRCARCAGKPFVVLALCAYLNSSMPGNAAVL